MKIKVEVTQEDIALGIREDSANCPIACALKRLGYTNPDIETIITFQEEYLEYKGYTPQIALDFIDAFDKGQVVQPLTFDLEVTERDYE